MSSIVRALILQDAADYPLPVAPDVEAKRYMQPMDWSSTSQAKSLTGLNTSAGQLVVPFGMLEDDSQTIGTPTGNSLTFVAAAVATGLSKGYTAIWTAIDAAGGSNWTLAASRSSVGTYPWGLGALVAPSGWTKGAANSAVAATGLPAVSLTTTADNSAVLVVCENWQATDDSGHVWNSVNGFRPTALNMGEWLYQYVQTHYTVYAALYPDVGAAGVKSLGFESGVGTGGWGIAALEIKAPSGGGGGPIAFEGWGVPI